MAVSKGKTNEVGNKTEHADDDSESDSEVDEEIRTVRRSLAASKFRKNSLESVVASVQQEVPEAVVHPGQKFFDMGRTKWPREAYSVLSLIAFAADIANVARFPFLCYTFGGSAFLIPYFTFLVVTAFPLLYMELIIGQFVQQGSISVWKIVPIFKGIGYCIQFIVMLTEFYYMAVIPWSLVFITSSMNVTAERLAWTTCTNPWNTPRCIEFGADSFLYVQPNDIRITAGSEYFKGRVLRLYESRYTSKDYPVEDTGNFTYGFNSDKGLGSVNPDLALWLVVYFIVIFFIMLVGIRISGKVVWLTATAPYMILAILFFRGVTLPGAQNGLRALITPDFRHLLRPDTWAYAAVQTFFSSGAGFGVHLTTASHNHFNQNVLRDAIITVTVDSFTSLFAAAVVFCYLGNMAHVRRKDIPDVVKDGVALLFEVFPDSIGTLPGARLYAFLFFLMIILITFDTAMSASHSHSTAFHDEFTHWFPNRRYTLEVICFTIVSVMYAGGLFCVTRGGIWVYLFMDMYAAGASLTSAILIQTIAVSWVWGMEDICDAAEAMTGYRPGIYFRICWKFIAPMSLVPVIWFMASGSLEGAGITYEGESAKNETLVKIAGGLLGFVPLLCIPFYAIYQLIFYPKGRNFRERARLLFSPENEHDRILFEGRSSVRRLTVGHIMHFGNVFANERKFSRVDPDVEGVRRMSAVTGNEREDFRQLRKSTTLDLKLKNEVEPDHLHRKSILKKAMHNRSTQNEEKRLKISSESSQLSNTTDSVDIHAGIKGESTKKSLASSLSRKSSKSIATGNSKKSAHMEHESVMSSSGISSATSYQAPQSLQSSLDTSSRTAATSRSDIDDRSQQSSMAVVQLPDVRMKSLNSSLVSGNSRRKSSNIKSIKQHRKKSSNTQDFMLKNVSKGDKKKSRSSINSKSKRSK